MQRKTRKSPAKTDANEQLLEIIRGLVKIRDTLMDEKGIKPLLPICPPEWPHEEMQVVFRYLAGQAERPQHCSNRRCRRAGMCQAGADALLEADCFPDWSDSDVSRLHAAWLGVVLCWIYDCERSLHFMEMTRYGTQACSVPTRKQGLEEAGKKLASRTV